MRSSLFLIALAAAMGFAFVLAQQEMEYDEVARAAEGRSDSSLYSMLKARWESASQTTISATSTWDSLYPERLANAHMTLTPELQAARAACEKADEALDEAYFALIETEGVPREDRYRWAFLMEGEERFSIDAEMRQRLDAVLKVLKREG